MQRQTYTIYKFHDKDMQHMLDHENKSWGYCTVKDFNFPKEIEKFEMPVKEIWENVSSLGWSVFPMSEYISEIKKYIDMGLNPVFVRYNTDYKDLCKDYKEFVMSM